MIGSRLITLAIVALVAAGFAFHVWQVGRSFDAGRLAERAEWQEQRATDLAIMEAQRKRAADQIAEIERKYVATKQEAAIEVADLEKALAEEKANAAKVDPSGACRPGPAVSRRVRDELQKLGHR